ncbi:MAG: HDOD domain-containing protein [Gemmatimonadales bacterium]
MTELKAEMGLRAAAVLELGRGSEEAAAVLRQVGELNTVVRRPPAAIQQAMEACRDPDASLDRIVNTFRRDPALAQSLLRHANAPFYSRGGASCGSLTEAARRVGLAGLSSVLMSSLMESLLSQPGGDLGRLVQQVWTHSVRTAPIARTLAGVASLGPERVFTLGLLHDFGKLLILDRFATYRAQGGGSLASAEFVSVSLKALHGPLGGLAALTWSLDVEASAAIATHDRGPLRYQGSVLSEVLSIAEWADLTEIREREWDFEGHWERAGLTLPIEDCRTALDPGD